MLGAASSVSIKTRIAGWVVPLKEADDSVAEQYLRGFSRERSGVQVGDTVCGGL